MDDFKVIPCKSRPGREFLVDANKPKDIGIRQINTMARFWFDKKQVEAEIEKLERDLEFWRELGGLFE